MMKLPRSFEFLGYAWNTPTTMGDPGAPLKVLRRFDSAQYHSPSCYLEIVNLPGWPDQGTVKLQYYDGSWQDVSGASVSYLTTDVRKRSSSFSLPVGAFEYKIQGQGQVGGWLNAVRVHIIDSADEITKNEGAFDIAKSIVYSHTEYKRVSGFFLWQTGVLDGTVTVQLEATVFQTKTSGSPDSRRAYVELFDETDDVSVVEVYTTETTPTRVRSSNVTLTNGHVYTIQMRHASGEPYTTKMTMGSISMQQLNFTKTRVLLHLCYGEWQGYDAIRLTQHNQDFDHGDYDGYDFKGTYLEATLCEIPGGSSGFPKLPYSAVCLLYKDGASVGSVSHNDTYYMRKRTSNLDLASGELDSAVKETLQYHSAAIFCAWVLIDVGPPPVPGVRYQDLFATILT